jgi:alkylated DNA nucleotide flippase Atl1
MAEERLYMVDGTAATPAEPITLTSAGLLERTHLQEWVLEHPEILGEDVLVVTFEFDRWITGGGDRTWERLDVLALDRTGRLVVAELKRDRAPDSVLVQALNYAAMASRFSVDSLADAYADRKSEQLTGPEVLGELREWAPTLSDESLGPPRIVLVAEDFGPVMTSTSLFLIERGLDLRLMRVQLYRMANDTIALTSSQVLPVPDAEEFMVRPRSGGTTQQATRVAATRRSSATVRLVENEVFADGDELRIAVQPGVREDRAAIEEWLRAEPARAVVQWRQDAKEPVIWAVDGRAWNLTTLIRHIVEEATGAPPLTNVWGLNWFETPAGEVLHKVAERLPDMGSSQRFDWSSLHEVLVALPKGRWTTYGDLAGIVGTAAQPVGNHIASCGECENAWRVLGADGRPRPSFAWTDPTDTRTQEEALAQDGVAFQAGAADPARRVTTAELQSLYDTLKDG